MKCCICGDTMGGLHLPHCSELPRMSEFGLELHKRAERIKAEAEINGFPPTLEGVAAYFSEQLRKRGEC